MYVFSAYKHFRFSIDPSSCKDTSKSTLFKLQGYFIILTEKHFSTLFLKHTKSPTTDTVSGFQQFYPKMLSLVQKISSRTKIHNRLIHRGTYLLVPVLSVFSLNSFDGTHSLDLVQHEFHILLNFFLKLDNNE